MYSTPAPNRMRTDSQSHDGVLSQSTAQPSLHSLSNPVAVATITTNLEPVKDPYRESVEHNQISPSHYSVPPSLRKYVCNYCVSNHRLNNYKYLLFIKWLLLLSL